MGSRKASRTCSEGAFSFFFDSLEEGASTVDRARLKGVSAAHAGAFLVAAPSRGLDMLLTNEEVSSRVGRRLGVAICEEQTCPFYFGIMDRFGIHAESCMAGGDKTAAHHCVRNDVYHHAGRGNTGPVLEAAGVLDMLGVQDAQGRLGERPADVAMECTGSAYRYWGEGSTQGGFGHWDCLSTGSFAS